MKGATSTGIPIITRVTPMGIPIMSITIMDILITGTMDVIVSMDVLINITVTIIITTMGATMDISAAITITITLITVIIMGVIDGAYFKVRRKWISGESALCAVGPATLTDFVIC
jgi:hypothetical protein